MSVVPDVLAVDGHAGSFLARHDLLGLAAHVSGVPLWRTACMAFQTVGRAVGRDNSRRAVGRVLAWRQGFAMDVLLRPPAGEPYI